MAKSLKDEEKVNIINDMPGVIPPENAFVLGTPGIVSLQDFEVGIEIVRTFAQDNGSLPFRQLHLQGVYDLHRNLVATCLFSYRPLGLG